MKIDPYLFILPYTVSVILVLSSAGIKTLYCLMLQENKTYLPSMEQIEAKQYPCDECEYNVKY